MKIIVTGGTGLIGSHLIQSLVSDHHEVILLTRRPDANPARHEAVQVVGWDARTPQGWVDHVENAHAIINLAGESIGGSSFVDLVAKRWTDGQKKRILQSRLDAGNAIIEAVRLTKNKPKVLVQASAVGYYGDRGDEVLTEDARPGNDFAAGVCQAWEKSTSPVEEMGVRRVIIRTAGVVVSLLGGAFPFMVLPFRLFAGGPLGSGKQWFSWIHIADEVNAIRFLIDHPTASGPVNLVAPHSLTNAQFGRILGKVMHRPAFFPTPAFLLRIAFGEKAEILLASQKQIPRKLQQLGYQFKYPEAEQAITDVMGK